MKPSSYRTTNLLLLRAAFCFCARLLLVIGFIAITGVLQSLQAASPPFEWANVAGTVNDDYGRAMAVDAAGNTYVTGSIDGMATFGSTNFGSTNITSSGGSNRPDIFVSKYNAGGQLLWVREIGGTGTDLAFGIAVDSSSNVIVTGSSDRCPVQHWLHQCFRFCQENPVREVRQQRGAALGSDLARPGFVSST
jgi:hypothetical protein